MEKTSSPCASPITTEALTIVVKVTEAETAANDLALKTLAQEVNRASRGEGLTSEEKRALVNPITEKDVERLTDEANKIREDASSPALKKAADLKNFFQKTLQAIKPTL